VTLNPHPLLVPWS